MSSFLKALHCENYGTPPVWIMRQAGRYLPSYRALRKEHSLSTLFHTPKLAAEVTKLPFEVLDLDAAIVFSDILVMAEAVGLKVHFPESGGPYIEPALKTAEDIYALKIQNVEQTLHYVFETISLLQNQLTVPLIGFCGGPFTVASYLMQGEAKTKEWLVRDPTSFHYLLELLTESTISYLRHQVKAGVQAIQIFDSWANLLTPAQFLSFSALYLHRIVEAIKDTLKDTEIPVILFCRGSCTFVNELSAIKPAAISFDWQRELSEMREIVPAQIAVQGNIDPHLLKEGTLDMVQEAVEKLLISMDGEPGFIVNLGHGILPETPVENVQCFVNTVHHFATGGREHSMASGLPPDLKPN